MKNNEDVSLTITSQFGKGLVAAAQAERQETLKKACIGEVESILTLIELSQDRIKDQQNRLEVYKARLAAVEAGKVEINPNVSGLKIRYLDEKLRPETAGF